jgi:uncharacterized protein (DUF1330 family)
VTSYALGIYRIRDGSWRPAYREAQKKILPRYGGRYLVRSDGAWEMLEGTPPSATAFTILQFPSMDLARDWHRDPEYAPFIELRRKHSELDLVLVEGSDG